MKEVQSSSLVNFSKSNPGQQPKWLCWSPGLPAAGFSSVQLFLAFWMCKGQLRLTGSPLSPRLYTFKCTWFFGHVLWFSVVECVIIWNSVPYFSTITLRRKQGIRACTSIYLLNSMESHSRDSEQMSLDWISCEWVNEWEVLSSLQLSLGPACS